MKILILGNGVIGSVYGWQLSLAGYDVTHFIRKEKAEYVEINGIEIKCLDGRNNSNKMIETTYRPKIKSVLDKDEKYDLFIISSKSHSLEAVLCEFKDKISPHTTILIFQSLWNGIEEINKYLNEDQYIFGFPHIMGGGKYKDGIHCTIFGSKDAPTMLGEKDGKITERIKRIEEIFNKADMNPLVSEDILSWIYTHYCEAAGLLAGIMEAGGYEGFVKNRKYIKDTIVAIREGLNVCIKRGINAKKIKPQSYYYWPTFIMSRILQNMYNTEATKVMVEGHISHSTTEMKDMVFDVIKSGKKYNVSTKRLQEMGKSVIDFKI